MGVKAALCLPDFSLSGAFKHKLVWIGLFIIRFQGVTGAQGCTNILVYSGKEQIWNANAFWLIVNHDIRLSHVQLN